VRWISFDAATIWPVKADYTVIDPDQQTKWRQTGAKAGTTA